ncbi:MAG: hypothetical protein ACOX9R_19640 [Armatimonadota bacterium]
MEQNEPTESQSEDREADDVAPAYSFATVLKGIVNRIYADGDRNFGFVLHGEEEYYFDPRLVASEETPLRGDRVFFTPKPPLKPGAKPAAACVLVKQKPAVGTVVNMLPNGKSCFLQVRDELGNHFNVYMPISTPLGNVSLGDRFRFIAERNPRGPLATCPKRTG